MTFDKDLYEILNIKKNASDAEIRKAFLKLAKKYHPDVNPGDKEAEQRFKEVNLAYEVLKDSKKRAQYDQMRAAGADPFARAGGGQAGGWRSRGTGGFGPEAFADFGLGDLFQEIFSGGFGGFGGAAEAGTRRARRQTATRGFGFSQRGADREATLNISFLDAARGAERTVEFSDGKRLTVKIPEGVADGAKIKLSGQGEPGMGTAPAGDLIITLQVDPHPYFQREGQDILLKLPVTFPEAVLGSEVSVPTLDGNVVLKIPPGVSSGQRLKLAGKGIRNPKTSTRGDQFVEVSIKIPRSPTDAYREAAEKTKTDGFNPREGIF